MHICVYNTAYGYIRVARYTSAAMVTIVDLFFMRQKKKLNIEYDSHDYWVCFLQEGEKNEQRAYSTTSITRWQHSNV